MATQRPGSQRLGGQARLGEDGCGHHRKEPGCELWASQPRAAAAEAPRSRGVIGPNLRPHATVEISFPLISLEGTLPTATRT